jgi:hypothetical protein
MGDERQVLKGTRGGLSRTCGCSGIRKRLPRHERYTLSGGQRDGLKDVLLQEPMHHQGPLVTGGYIACLFCHRVVRPAAGEGDETCQGRQPRGLVVSLASRVPL